MAYLVLGQSNPAATTLTTLYTVPSAKSAVCSTLVVCNQAGTTTTAVTTRRAVLSIRPAATFNSITNRSRIDPVTVSIYTDAAIYYEVIRGGTLGGSPSWASAGTNSAVEKDVAGTTVTNGDVVAAGYIATSGGAAKADARVTLTDNGLLPLPLALDSAGANPIVFSVVATSVSGTAHVAASVQWTEIR